MALALVQSADAPGTNTAVVAFGSNVTAGNLIVVMGGPYANGGVPTETVTGVTDSQGNTYTFVRGPDNDGQHTKGYIYVATAGSTGACTVTLTCSGTPAGGGCIAGVFEVSGTSPTIETSNGGGGTSSGTVTGPSLTVAGAALLIAFQFSFATTNSSNNNGWTGSVTVNGDGIGNKAVTAGTYATNGFNVTANGSNPWFIEAVAVKEAAGAAQGATDVGRQRLGPPRRPPFVPSALARPSALATITGTVNVTEGTDTLTAAGTISQLGSVPASDHFGGPPRRPPFTSGPLGQPLGGLPAITGTVNVTESADSISATGTVQQLGTTVSRSSGPPRRPPFRSSPLQRASAPAPRLTVDASGRYLRKDGQPYRLHTSAAWFACTNAQPGDLSTLFSGIKAQGFNSLLLMSMLYPGAFSGTPNAPGNYNGDLPFTTCISTGGVGNTNFDESSPAYWSWIESIVAAADAADVTIVFNVCYFSHWNQGWNDASGARPLAQAHNTASSYAACTAFGQALASRFGRYRNIVWHLVGDDSSTNTATTYTATQVAAHHAMAAAIAAAIPGAIFTGEPFGPDERLRSTCGDFADIINVDSIYGYGPGGNARTYVTAQAAWAASPTMPLWMAEPDYEGVDVGAGPASAQRCRKEAWWAALGGALAGQNYGTANLWNYQTASSAWQTALTSTGMQQQAKLHALFNSVSWWKLQPVLNGGTQLLTVNTGAWNTDTYAQSALAADGSLAVVYIPPNGSGSQSVTVDLSQFSGAVSASWYDPTSGATTGIGSFANSGTQAFASSGNNASGDNDWVLLLAPLAPATGTASVSEGADTTTASGTLAIAGTSSTTEGADTTSASGTLAIAGTSSTTEGADTTTAAGSVPATGTSSTTEGADTTTATGALTVTGTSSTAEGADTTTAAGALTVTGTSSVTEGADTLSATGTTTGAITGSASVTEGADSVSATGSVAIAATAAVTEGADTLSATGTAPGGPITGTASVTESADALSATGTVRITGSATVTEGADTLTSAPGIAPTEATLAWEDLTQTEATLALEDLTAIVATLTWESF